MIAVVGGSGAAACRATPPAAAHPVTVGSSRCSSKSHDCSRSGAVQQPLRRGHVLIAAAAQPPNIDLDALLGELEAPEIDADLATLQAEQGAVFDDAGVVVHYKNDSRAMHALEHTAVVADRSHWGRLRLSGEGRLAFLHGQSTADIQAPQPGSGCDTVFVTAQARTIDLATVLAQGSGLLVLVSPGMKQQVAERLDKHIFPGDQVQLMDVSSKTSMFSVLGPQADAVMQQMQAGGICGAPYGTHTLLSFRGKPVIVVSGGGLSGPGYTLIADESVAADVWRALTSQEGVEPFGADCWEMARVLAGRPKAGAELTEDYNPLEAGLYHACSVTKGCSIGQETINKVHNLSAVKQQLWGLEMEAPCTVGDTVEAPDGTKLGKVTSYIDTPSGQHRALAYLKCKVQGQQLDLEGLRVTVAGARGTVVAPPFLTRSFPEQQQATTAGAAAAGDAAGSGASAAGAAGPSEAELAAQQAQQEKEAAEEQRRAEKLAAMQARLAAFQEQQQADA
ncbi:glycine cleavage system T [Chlorella sorokiniana]|uniref:Glycine cleavage system T n=1 Tax=Chlorella sorokiniana TaxID=3076 RepID=A0A2P6U4C3_CHLSO|nr:glycine cleavage system T [Chlorella sorokiniana]|eukprot:PRW61168.1 glycine cleavage system T [Chlorella sorokiniana]